MKGNQPLFNLPELSISWADLGDGLVMGGPLFICRARGCEMFRRTCGEKPPTIGGAIKYCDYPEARIETLRRFQRDVREWYKEETK